MHYKSSSHQQYSHGKGKQVGFTLIETIVGIVLLSIVFSIFTTLIYPLSKQSAERVHQIRAAELGQSLMNEILGKAFDENSDMSGGFFRCGEDQNNDGLIKSDDGETCTLEDDLRSEESDRTQYDDVDDYINLPSSFVSSLGGTENIYVGFEVNVTVKNDSDYDGDYDEGIDNNFTAKLITITITTPQKFDFVFSAYKANF